ncbi:SRPBCC domain-containing protein [Chitinophaga sp. 22321]|uniref:SRPBCC domain-containing protein n=1 Tax=Chitinophaga hostae TaxID=2831022 RepID=A0ABS5J5S8_9BACT|nr:SRPBCC domain-containing protein [Chitinophaga hostae]MBS0030403.1 SRPBCC domain-containing protein [Chitinophaga hostae]
MNQQDYQSRIVANTTAGKAFNSINNVAAWWTENTEGSATRLNDVFTVHFGATYMTFNVVEFVPNKKAVWLVTDCFIPQLKDKKEWNDTRISFEITTEAHLTTIDFMHIGIVPGIECYDSCVKSWDQFTKTSLFNLITNGKGAPIKKVLVS